MLKDYGFFHEKPSEHLIVFSTETVNIKKLANLTANTKNYGQITLNTKPHSDALVFLACSSCKVTEFTSFNKGVRKLSLDDTFLLLLLLFLSSF